MNRENSPNTSFQRHEVVDYERKRYRAWDQKLVDRKEKKILEKMFEEISDQELKVLDLPSGYGRFSELLLKRRFHLVTGDLSFHMVERARERGRLDSLHSAVVADAKKGLPFKKDTFDIVLSMRFFHHLPNAEERKSVLHEFSAVTAKWVILSYYQKTFSHLLQRKLRRKVKKTKRRISMISREEFLEEIRQAGLTVVETYPLFKGIHAHHIALLKKAKI